MLAYDQTQMLYALVKLGIADLLAENLKTANELALKANAHALYRLMWALASCALVKNPLSSITLCTPLDSKHPKLASGFFPFHFCLIHL
jgi:hypothetical protein